jgi:hypothetical protein
MIRFLYTLLFLPLTVFAKNCQTPSCLIAYGEIKAGYEQTVKEHGDIVNIFKEDILEHIKKYPDLTVEEAFCVVSRDLNPNPESSKRCLQVIRKKYNIELGFLRSELVYNKYQLYSLKKEKEGSYSSQIDEDGLYLIELSDEGKKFWNHHNIFETAPDAK